ncbi:MAG TPA: MazG nucleotide pyrophosphohydrolase domain-containing protein [Candidatus Saccharimonadales bacterium]|nr:MazG nucleotide pyrophosphohydrolase domain-containing protein [Candidatus Saccharimonadales bacterium]
MAVFPETDSLQAIQEYTRVLHHGRGFDTESVAQKMLLLTEEVGELAKGVRNLAKVKFADDAKRTEAAEEVGDVFIVLVDVCNKLGIDLYEAYCDKEMKNRKRVWK